MDQNIEKNENLLQRIRIPLRNITQDKGILFDANSRLHDRKSTHEINEMHEHVQKSNHKTLVHHNLDSMNEDKIYREDRSLTEDDFEMLEALEVYSNVEEINYDEMMTEELSHVEEMNHVAVLSNLSEVGHVEEYIHDAPWRNDERVISHDSLTDMIHENSEENIVAHFSPTKIPSPWINNNCDHFETIDDSDTKLKNFLTSKLKYFSEKYFESLLTSENTTIEWIEISSPGICMVYGYILDDAFDELKSLKFANDYSSSSSLNELSQDVFIYLSSSLLEMCDRTEILYVLLHEMIHAYLIITKEQFHSNHGIYFQQKLREINTKENFSIPLFNLSTDHSHSHEWVCSQCFLTIYRDRNHPPSPLDLWWKFHNASCKGSFRSKQKEQPRARRKIDTAFDLESNFESNEVLNSTIVNEEKFESIPTINEIKTNDNLSKMNESSKINNTFESKNHLGPYTECPICKEMLETVKINFHLESCLKKARNMQQYYLDLYEQITKEPTLKKEIEKSFNENEASQFHKSPDQISSRNVISIEQNVNSNLDSIDAIQNTNSLEETLRNILDENTRERSNLSSLDLASRIIHQAQDQQSLLRLFFTNYKDELYNNLQNNQNNKSNNFHEQ